MMHLFRKLVRRDDSVTRVSLYQPVGVMHWFKLFQQRLQNLDHLLSDWFPFGHLVFHELRALELIDIFYEWIGCYRNSRA
mmetsp:Transcript_2424/g.3519  ORF Transcript_2424/g.3519 Transcript_2424/m.3519 type:complete len:80 (+) Transcript_2424:42-281(+)